MTGMKTSVMALLLGIIILNGAQAVCNDCILQIIPVSNNLCQGEPVVYDIQITNVNDNARAISLSAAGDIPMTSDMPSQITVGPYQTERIRTTFTPAQDILGQHRISITASGYGVSDSDDAIFSVNDCYSADLQILQQSIDLCEGSVGRVDFIVRNTGQRKDDYTIFVRGVTGIIGVSFAGGRMSLAPGESRTGSITLRGLSNDYGSYDVELIVKSPMKSVSKKLRVNLVNCYYATVSAPDEFVSCPEAGLTYTVNIRNKGCVPNTYSLELSGTCRAHLTQDSIYLEAGEEKDIAVTLEPDMGECNLTLAAVSAYDSHSDTTNVKLMECYDVDLEIIPPEITACHGEPVTYDLKVRNTGYYADDYTLSISGMDVPLERDFFSLASGESGETSFDVMGTWCVTDAEIPFTVSATGHATDTENGYLRLLPFGEGSCADIELVPELDPTQIDCRGDAYTFYVKNTGYVKQQVSLSLEGGNYLIQPDSILLRPKETRPVALYILPLDVPEHSKITVVATGENKQAFMELNIDLEGPVCMVSRPPELEISEPAGPVLPTISTIASESGPENQSTGETPAGAAAAVAGAESSSLLLLLMALLVLMLFLFILLLIGVKSRTKGKRGFSFPEIKSAIRGSQTKGEHTDLEV